MVNFGHIVGNILPFDITPGYNIDSHPGGGVPFVSKGNGSTGNAPQQASSQGPGILARPTGNAGQPTTTVAGGSGGSYSGPSAQDLAQYGYYTGLANDALGNLDSNYAKEQGAINHQYGVKRNEYDSAKNAANQSLQQSLDQARGQFVTNQNQINQNAHQAQQSLLRQLGILGAGGGSAALFALPNLIGQETNQALSGAGQNFAQNAQGANTAYNNYVNTQYNPGIQQLADWRQNQLHTQEGQYNQTHQGLLNVLKGLQNHSANADTLGSQVLNYQSQIPNAIQPAENYTGNIAQYTAPTLNSYEQQVLPQAQVQGPQSSSPQSFLALLAGQQRKQANQLI